jgi:hypothetical protein
MASVAGVFGEIVPTFAYLKKNHYLCRRFLQKNDNLNYKKYEKSISQFARCQLYYCGMGTKR